jgi:hypothetical protein
MQWRCLEYSIRVDRTEYFIVMTPWGALYKWEVSIDRVHGAEHRD